MLSDNVAIALALFAFWLAVKPPTPNRSFGYKRTEILAALFNGITIVAISIWIFFEAFNRFQDPPKVLGSGMMTVAVIGLLVNVAGVFILSRSAGDNLNMQGALRHVFADVLGSVGAIAAAIVIITTGYQIADPIISVVIGILVLFSSWKLLRDSINILLQNSPPDISAEEVSRRIVDVEGVQELRDLHVWMVTSGFPALSAHVMVGPDEDCHQKRLEMAELLQGEFGIEHTTIQVDHVGEESASDPRCVAMEGDVRNVAHR
jgi:cobalt-zinc-cadmium efflux system protein